MKSDRLSADYLQDMLEASIKAADFIKDMTFNEFNNDEKTQYAVVRALEIIGEAAKKVTQPVKDQNPRIPWRTIAGMRDKMIHDYMGINQAVDLKTIIEDIPLLTKQLQAITNLNH